MSRIRAADDFDFIRAQKQQLERERQAVAEQRAKDAQAEAVAVAAQTIADREAEAKKAKPEDPFLPCGFLPPHLNIVRFESRSRRDHHYYFFHAEQWHGPYSSRSIALGVAIIIGALTVEDLSLLLRGEA